MISISLTENISQKENTKTIDPFKKHHQNSQNNTY